MDDLEWRRGVDRTIRMLIQRTAKKPVRLSNSPGGSGGGGGNWVEATTVGGLPDPNPLTKTTQGRVTEGPQRDQIYKIKYNATTELYDWECVSETYEADTEAALENGGVIGKFAVGRVGDIYYRRNDGNTGWEAQNKWA